MERDVVVAGFGGQGVQLIGSVLAHAANEAGRSVLYYSAYGGSMRGGPVYSTIVIADAGKDIGSPMRAHPAAAIAMNDLALGLFGDAVKPGGVLLVNSSLIRTRPDRKDITILSVPTDEMAKELGDRLVVSMIAMGAFVERTKIVSVEQLLKGLEEAVPPHRARLIPLNRKAIMAGVEFARAGKDIEHKAEKSLFT